MNYTGPKVRLSRRLGIAITPKAAKVMEKRDYPPGQHGRDQQFKRQRESDFKRQLREKQRLRAQYNITERQLGNYYAKVSLARGNTGELLIQMMERRLDALVLRAGFARTIYAARQYVTHGHILVNEQRINLPGYLLKPGDTIAVKPKSRRIPVFVDAVEAAAPPSYMALNRNQMSAQFLRIPDRDEVPVICDESAVVEYYSR